MSKPGQADLEKDEEEVLREFFAAPTPKTTLIVLFQGKLGKTKALYKLFDSLPRTVVRVEEMKSFKEYELGGWIAEAAGRLGKKVAPDAAARLIEVVGS